ncbi:MAG: hypothetical protein AAGI44_09665 [Pseudomonadota bacterium]
MQNSLLLTGLMLTNAFIVATASSQEIVDDSEIDTSQVEVIPHSDQSSLYFAEQYLSREDAAASDDGNRWESRPVLDARIAPHDLPVTRASESTRREVLSSMGDLSPSEFVFREEAGRSSQERRTDMSESEDKAGIADADTLLDIALTEGNLTEDQLAHTIYRLANMQAEGTANALQIINKYAGEIAERIVVASAGGSSLARDRLTSGKVIGVKNNIQLYIIDFVARSGNRALVPVLYDISGDPGTSQVVLADADAAIKGISNTKE